MDLKCEILKICLVSHIFSSFRILKILFMQEAKKTGNSLKACFSSIDSFS